MLRARSCAQFRVPDLTHTIAARGCVLHELAHKNTQRWVSRSLMWSGARWKLGSSSKTANTRCSVLSCYRGASRRCVCACVCVSESTKLIRMLPRLLCPNACAFRIVLCMSVCAQSAVHDRAEYTRAYATRARARNVCFAQTRWGEIHATRARTCAR